MRLGNMQPQEVSRSGSGEHSLRNTVWSTILWLCRKVSEKSLTVPHSTLIYDAFRQPLHFVLSTFTPHLSNVASHSWDFLGFFRVNKQNSVLAQSPLSLPTLPAGRLDWLTCSLLDHLSFSPPSAPMLSAFIFWGWVTNGLAFLVVESECFYSSCCLAVLFWRE